MNNVDLGSTREDCFLDSPALSQAESELFQASCLGQPDHIIDQLIHDCETAKTREIHEAGKKCLN